MAESTVWTALKKGMKPYWRHARRHEDTIGVGVSDVSYYYEGNGWIELKEVKKLPARATTGITLGQWHNNSGAQRFWLTQREGWLFVRVNAPEKIWLLFDHCHLPPWEMEERWTWDQFTLNANTMWTPRVDWEEFADLIKVRDEIF